MNVKDDEWCRRRIDRLYKLLDEIDGTAIARKIDEEREKRKKLEAERAAAAGRVRSFRMSGCACI